MSNDRTQVLRCLYQNTRQLLGISEVERVCDFSAHGGQHTVHLPRTSREPVLDVCDAGPEAVVSLFEYLQDVPLSNIEESRTGIEELEM